MSGSTEADLGALLHRVLATVVERETPILEGQGISMWEYAILTALEGTAPVSQTELARRSRRDPTRLIANLDALEQRGLVARDIDPDDRRRRAVQLTDDGRARLRAARRGIRGMESELLAELSASERASLRAMLGRIAGG